MQFDEVRDMLRGRVVFRGSELEVSHRRLSLWCKAGKIARLSKGVYRLGGETGYDQFELAALLSPRSYITGWSALEYHRLLMKLYEGPVCSALEGRAFQKEIEGTTYRFEGVGPCQLRRVLGAPDRRFRVADPLTAILDLCHRREPPIHRSTPVRFGQFDPEELTVRLFETSQRCKRRAIGRLLALCRLRRRQGPGVERHLRAGSPTFSPSENP